ncbi:unnamed protein product [Macrosiphum euphorbiae]|uniref:Inhibitor of growth protein n=1 Tax=Macrosiphum euphorbiae TaxID=13131 RepID=A0AAV0WY74_9HEMI|nr:unnamed protein product [Macrosiphum euphorbiae]
MTSGPYLENYLDSLKNLPVELHRNFDLMRDLDSKIQELLRNIDKLANDYLSNIRRYSVEKKNETMTRIQRGFDKAKKYGDDKVQLAMENYELVDTYIRKHDSAFASYEAEIEDKAIRNIEEGSKKRRQKKTKDKDVKNKSASSEEETVTKKSEKKQLKKGAKSTGSATRKTPLVSVVTSPTNSTNSIASVTVDTSSLTGALVGDGVAHSAEVLDMPVDPNEPTYCLCDQVSYGEMIGCDNPDCSIEWFHFECVELIKKPKGKWFCPICITDRVKK